MGLMWLSHGGLVVSLQPQGDEKSRVDRKSLCFGIYLHDISDISPVQYGLEKAKPDEKLLLAADAFKMAFRSTMFKKPAASEVIVEMNDEEEEDEEQGENAHHARGGDSYALLDG